MHLPIAIPAKNEAAGRATFFSRSHALYAGGETIVVNRWLVAIIVCAALLVYSQGLSGPFLYDDAPNITYNTLLAIDGSSFDELRTASLSSTSGPLRRPIAMFTFALQHAVSGEFSAAAMKAANIGIHFFIAALIYLLCHAIVDELARQQQRESRAQAIAIAATLLWLVHPLHVSTVLYVVQRMAQLSTLFVVLGLLVFVRYRSLWARSGATVGDILAALLWLGIITLAAVLSKENGALLPWLILVVEVTIYRGLWNGRAHNSLGRSAWVFMLLPLVIVVTAFLLWPSWFYDLYLDRHFTLEERLLTQGRLLWQYIGWMVVPNINAMGLHHDDIALSSSLWQPLTTGLSLLAWAVGLAVAVVLRKRVPLLLFVLLFYLVAHSMESGFWPLLIVYEHRNYLPSVALCLLFSATVMTLVERLPVLKWELPTLLLPALLLLLLYVRVFTWADAVRLNHVSAINHPQSPSAQYSYANTLMELYNSGDAQGLDKDARIAALVSARSQFESVLGLDEAHVASLVKLYQIDSIYFPSLDTSDSWLARLESVLAVRRLTVTDKVALGVLFECWARSNCPENHDAPLRIFATFQERFPDSSYFAKLHYDYLLESKAPRDQRMAVLAAAVEANPKDMELYSHLVNEALLMGDKGKVYEQMRQIILADPGRLRLPLYAPLFNSMKEAL